MMGKRGASGGGNNGGGGGRLLLMKLMLLLTSGFIVLNIPLLMSISNTQVPSAYFAAYWNCTTETSTSNLDTQSLRRELEPKVSESVFHETLKGSWKTSFVPESCEEKREKHSGFRDWTSEELNKKKFYFLHMRKAGGSTVRKSFFPELCHRFGLGENLKCQQNEEVLGVDFDKLLEPDVFSFVNLADPIRRLLSQYENEGAFPNRYSFKPKDRTMNMTMPFDTWIKYSQEKGRRARTKLFNDFATNQNMEEKYGKRTYYIPEYYTKKLGVWRGECNEETKIAAKAILLSFDFVLPTGLMSNASFTNYTKQIWDLDDEFEFGRAQWYFNNVLKGDKKTDNRENWKKKLTLKKHVKENYPELLDEIRQQNQCDMEVYNFAVSLVEKRMNEGRICSLDEGLMRLEYSMRAEQPPREKFW